MTSPSDLARQYDERFADNLVSLRNHKNLTRRDLAERTGIPVYTIEKIETGQGCRKGRRRDVSIGEAVVLSEALGVKPGDLLRARAVSRG